MSYLAWLFESDCGSFRVKIPNRVAHEMREFARRYQLSTPMLETGGVLTGYYSEDNRTVVVCEALGPPPDSVHLPCDFHRGLEGLQDRLDKRFHGDGMRYLGEWHTHPGNLPIASYPDRDTVLSISENADYATATPVMIILGGMWDDPDPAAYVADRGKLLHLTMLKSAQKVS